ncbi:histidine kinase [Paenibacillus sp. FSL R10-2734]|uniref:sensor histidine kinase n=1 Tax=Paenibacillus sp. FSL R10-2734 TaxID=2954691 RepID=UPI0030D7A2CE
MSIKRKLLFLYIGILGALFIVIGMVVYSYLSYVFESRTKNNLQSMNIKLNQQFESVIKPMDFSLTNLISDSEFMEATHLLMSINRTKAERVEIEKAIKRVNRHLVTYAHAVNFYRISVYNTKGDFLSNDEFASADVKDPITRLKKLMGTDHWIEEVGLNKWIIPNHIVLWSDNPKDYVTSLIRVVSNSRSEATVIETEILKDEIDKTFSVLNGEDVQVLVLAKDNSIIYYDSDRTLKSVSYYIKNLEQISSTPTFYYNDHTKSKELISRVHSNYTDTNIFVIQNESIVNEPVVLIRNIIIGLGALMLLLCILFYVVIVSRLMNPLRKLKEEMEATELYNLPHETEIDTSQNEIISLNQSYNHLKNRLNLAVQREVEARSMQLQASMDLLQAQVNPHFIYNIMNIFSYRGILLDDPDIIEMSEGLTSMLRYSTSNVEIAARISEEVEHVQHYLVLMKKRYEDCLNYDIQIASSIAEERVPKITLQIFIENAIKHSFEQGNRDVIVKLRGYQNGDRWVLEIEDNGGGFKEQQLLTIRKSLELAEKNFLEQREKLQLEIGGMGIVNTFIRLKIFFKDKLEFHISSEAGRTIVQISAEMESKAGGGLE